jgi:hypothetical protein
VNNKIEACRECPVQCELEDGARLIIDAVLGREVLGEKAAFRVSVLSQKAVGLSCPQSEVQRIRRYIGKETNDSAIIRLGNNNSFSRSGNNPIEFIPGTTEYTTYRQESYRRKLFRRG